MLNLKYVLMGATIGKLELVGNHRSHFCFFGRFLGGGEVSNLYP